MDRHALDWLVLGLAVFALTAGRSTWLSADVPWWGAFALWGGLVAAGALASGWRRKDEDA